MTTLVGLTFSFSIGVALATPAIASPRLKLDLGKITKAKAERGKTMMGRDSGKRSETAVVQEKEQQDKGLSTMDDWAVRGIQTSSIHKGFISISLLEGQLPIAKKTRHGRTAGVGSGTPLTRKTEFSDGAAFIRGMRACVKNDQIFGIELDGARVAATGEVYGKEAAHRSSVEKEKCKIGDWTKWHMCEGNRVAVGIEVYPNEHANGLSGIELLCAFVNGPGEGGLSAGDVCRKDSECASGKCVNKAPPGVAVKVMLCDK